MARMNVNPTRMELTSLKTRLGTTKRGYKLLKDKQDEMIRVYMSLIKENMDLRASIEAEMVTIIKGYDRAKLKMSDEEVKSALLVPSNAAEIETSEKSIMNVPTPKITFKDQGSQDLTYSFAFTSADLDASVIKLATLLPKLVRLSEVEKTCAVLAKDIEKTRRRVNAIEYVMIPDLEETIHYISQKLEDNDRSTTVRLMKSKDIILKKNAEMK